MSLASDRGALRSAQAPYRLRLVLKILPAIELHAGWAGRLLALSGWGLRDGRENGFRAAAGVLGYARLIDDVFAAHDADEHARVQERLGCEAPRPKDHVQLPEKAVDVVGILRRIIARAAEPAHVVAVGFGADEERDGRIGHHSRRDGQYHFPHRELRSGFLD